jgi:hypothetical protein
VDARHFAGYGCGELYAKEIAADRELRRFVSSQSNARVGDALTWPIPVSRIFGKNSRNVREISRLGGELNAIHRVQQDKQCAETMASTTAGTL